MTDEELITKAWANCGADMTREEFRRLIRLARVGLAFQNAIKEAENRRDAQDGLAALDAAGLQVVPKDPTPEMTIWREDAALPPSGSGEV